MGSSGSRHPQRHPIGVEGRLRLAGERVVRSAVELEAGVEVADLAGARIDQLVLVVDQIRGLCQLKYSACFMYRAALSGEVVVGPGFGGLVW